MQREGLTCASFVCTNACQGCIQTRTNTQYYTIWEQARVYVNPAMMKRTNRAGKRAFTSSRQRIVKRGVDIGFSWITIERIRSLVSVRAGSPPLLNLHSYSPRDEGQREITIKDPNADRSWCANLVHTFPHSIIECERASVHSRQSHQDALFRLFTLSLSLLSLFHPLCLSCRSFGYTWISSRENSWANPRGLVNKVLAIYSVPERTFSFISSANLIIHIFSDPHIKSSLM